MLFRSLEFQWEFSSEICNSLFQNSIQSVIIEGRQNFADFIDTNLWDEAKEF
jgi:hypothetical protein